MQDRQNHPDESASIAPTIVRLKRLLLPRALQTRIRLNLETVEEYADAMRAGDRFPPIIVYSRGGAQYVADGRHRCAAARQCGNAEIAAIVHEGTRTDALRHALGANSEHGLRRTNADKRRAVELALAAFADRSDRAIAEMCRVSQTMVSSVRAQLTNSVSCPSPRIGRDGIARRLPDPSIKPPASVTALTPAATAPGGQLLRQDARTVLFDPNAAWGAVRLMLDRALAGWPKHWQPNFHWRLGAYRDELARAQPDAAAAAQVPLHVRLSLAFALLAAAELLLEILDRAPGHETRLARTHMLVQELADIGKVAEQVAACSAQADGVMQLSKGC